MTRLCSEPSSNTQSLLAAQVFQEYGDSVVIRRFGVSQFGQEYCIFTRKRFLGGFQTYMVTANTRNHPFISPPFKISGYQVLEESERFVNTVVNILSYQTFNLREQPLGMSIPTTRDILQLDLVSSKVHDCPEKYLQKGDEIYVECSLSNISFFHSGIYAGHGEVYHFMSHNQEVDSALVTALSTFGRTPAAVVLDQWNEFIYALMDVGETPPRIFRVSHPLVCRAGDDILDECEQLRKEWSWYDIRNRNCQHFSSRCARGVEISYDMGNNFKYLACTIMRPSGILASNRLNSC